MRVTLYPFVRGLLVAALVMGFSATMYAPPGPPPPAAPSPAPAPGPNPVAPAVAREALIREEMTDDGSPVRLTGRQSFSGDWQRTDGPYTLSISDVDTDRNTVKVKYFNPQPINVESARFVKKSGKWELTIVLRDQGYEGSKYALYYDSEGPKLVGRYTLGATGQTFEIEFVRKKKSETGGPG